MNISRPQVSNQPASNLNGIREGNSATASNVEYNLFERKYLFKDYMVFDFDEEKIMNKFEDLINQLDQIL